MEENKNAGVSPNNGKVRRSWKHLEIPVSGSKVRRRYVPAGVSGFNADIRLCADCLRDCAGTYDKKKSGRGFRGLW